jgi:hypothetical protein
MHALDTRSARRDLDRLHDLLDPPSSVGPYSLTGLVARTDTALVYAATGGAFGEEEAILKLTSAGYAPLLARELDLLLGCAREEVDGVIRPLLGELLWLGSRRLEAAGMALPFCSGADLVGLIARSRPSSRLALDVGLRVGATLRALLALRRPIVHGDVRPQNVLLPRPDSLLAELTLIDLDAARQVDGPLEVAAAEPATAAAMAADVRGFGELLHEVATGREADSGAASLHSGNAAFDALVHRCLLPNTYVCLADEALWRDFDKALAAESVLRQRRGLAWP